jgi:hypothetical protein
LNEWDILSDEALSNFEASLLWFLEISI